MSITDVFRTAEDDAGGFDPEEAGNLGLHVRQCGRRYRALDRKLTLTLRLLLLLIGLYVLREVPGAWSAIRVLMSP